MDSPRHRWAAAAIGALSIERRRIAH